MFGIAASKPVSFGRRTICPDLFLVTLLQELNCIAPALVRVLANGAARINDLITTGRKVTVGASLPIPAYSVR